MTATEAAPAAVVTGKAARLLTRRRVLVLEAARGHALVEVTGDHDTYVVTRRRGGWCCPCPARRACSHLTAARAVLEPAVVPSVEGAGL